MEVITVMHTCGHEEEHPYTGRTANLEKWQKKTAEEACTECQIDKLYEKSREYRLPRLEGSPAQIKWALEIREELCQAYRELYSHLQLVQDKKEEKQRLMETIIKVYDLLHQKEAKFFIEHKTLLELLEFHKVVTVKKSNLATVFERDLFEGGETDEDEFKDNEEYRFD